MSFETVFEKWLQKQGVEGEDDKRREEQEGDNEDMDEEDGVEEDMPVIQREAWREEDMEGMPVLQKMIDLPSAQEDRKLGSPPPPPLQITLCLTENYKKETHSKTSPNKSPNKDKGRTYKTAGSSGKDYDSCPVLQDISSLLEKSTVAGVQTEGERSEGIQKLTCHPDAGDSSLHEKPHHRCHGKSALTELTRLNHITSPTVARALEVDAVHSPECDLPMEPDSTSEFMVGSGRWLRARKGSEASRGEVSPWREVSPRSTACTGLRTPSSSSEVRMRIEESPAECDSTSIFVNSPSAISPASQGEIEERVCPVLADHEDGASPSHFVCRCRSLPPPSDLINRDHAAVAVTTTSQLTVNVPGVISCQSKSKAWTPLVSHRRSVDDDPAPDLEKVAPSLDLMATPGDNLQCDHESPPVLTLPEQEARVKRFSVEHSHGTDFSSEVNQQEAPPLIRYEPEPPQVSHGDISTGTKYRDSPPVLSSNDFDSQDKCNESPPLLTLHGQEVATKPCKSKRQRDVCDFTSNIDWETAVVETVENPPSLTKYDGEGKPGIIIKIRTKGKPVTPPLHHSKPEPVLKVVPEKRKRNTIDNGEILSRLRKRHKSEDVDKSSAPIVEKEVLHTHPVGRKNIDLQHKAIVRKSTFHVSQTRPKDKKPRRSTIQLGELTVSTQDLCVKDSTFALCLVELSRLQTLAHQLMCILFPRLQPRLTVIASESRAFVNIIDDVILSLERSTSEEIMLDSEDLNMMFKKLSLKHCESVPVFSPRVELCGSPGHLVRDFRGKLCSLFQLLLPDLTVSLNQTLAHSSEKLELFLKKVIEANKAKNVKLCL